MPCERQDMTWKQIALFLLTFGALILAALVLWPFFEAIIGAIVLAVITQRPYDWLASKIRNGSLAATIALVLVILAIIVPCFFLAQDVGKQAFNAVSALSSDATQHKFSIFLGMHPALAQRVEAITSAIDPGHAAQTIASSVGHQLARLLSNSFRLISQIVIMLFLLFFLFRDRALAISFLRSILPLGEEEGHELLTRIGDTIYATALGRFAIAGVQGVLAGLAYWVLGVPGVALWAATTAVMAMIPALGAFLVWAPIAAYLGIDGHWIRALLLVIWGGGVVSLIDNVLYPILVGTRLRSHTATILVSILGGIALFGISGVILGPVVFTVAVSLLDFWRARTLDGEPVAEPAPAAKV